MPLHGKIVVIKRSGGDGTEFPLTASCLFGRKPDCDIRIQLPQVSKEHCRIELNENKEVILTNLSSVNPTRVNGEVMQQSERLKHGDVITVIDRSFRFEYPPAPTPKKRRSSTAGKAETLQVLQDQQVRDTATVETGEKSASTDVYLKDGTNNDNIQRSLEKTEVESKEDGSLLQSKASSPFSDLYQMIKQTLNVKTPRKPSDSQPASRFCTPKPASVRKPAGVPAVSTEVKSTPKKVEAEASSGTTAIEGNSEVENKSMGTPKSVKKQRKSFQVPTSEMSGLEPTEQSATSTQETPKNKRLSLTSRTPTTIEATSAPQSFTVSDAVEQISAEKPKTPTRRRSKEATPLKPAVTDGPEEQAKATGTQPSAPTTEPLRRTSPRSAEKKLKAQDVATARNEKQETSKRKSGELGADLPKPKPKRKRVSFGGQLDPELFDKGLPPDSPLRKGAMPRRSLCVIKPKHSSAIGLIKETPSPGKKSPKAAARSPKTPSPGKKSPKATARSPKTPSPGKKSPKAKTPSPKAEKSPKTQRKSTTPAQPQSVHKKTPTGKRRSFPVVSSPPSQENTTTVLGVTAAKPENQTPTVQGRFSVSRISTPSPMSEQDAAAVPVPVVAVTKLPLRRKSMKSTRKTPSALTNAVEVMRRRSGISRASMKVINSWADIVKFGQTKSQVVAPAKNISTTKKTRKVVLSKPKTPTRRLKDHVSTGHADSPVTIVVGKAHKQKLVQPTGAAPRLVYNTAVLKKSLKMDEDLTGVAEIFKTPANARQRKLVIDEQSATKTPLGPPTTSLIEASVLRTPEELGEMIVSPLNGASAVKHGIQHGYNSEAVLRLLHSDEESTVVSEIPALEITTEDPSEQQCTDLKLAVATPKQKPEQPECLTGIKRIMKTPRQKAEPVEENFGLKRLMKSPRLKGNPAVEDFEGLQELMEEPLSNPSAQMETNEGQDQTPLDCGSDMAKEPEVTSEEQQEDVPCAHSEDGPSDIVETVPQADIAKEPEVTSEGQQEDVPCAHSEDGPSDIVETVPQADIAKEPEVPSEEQQEDVPCAHSEDGPSDIEETVPQADIAKEPEADEVVCDDQAEEMPCDQGEDAPSDAMETVPQAAVDQSLPEEQPKVEAATCEVTEMDTANVAPDTQKKSARGRRAKVVEPKAADDEQEATEHLEDIVVPAPVKGRRGKKTESAPLPTVGQAARSRNAKSNESRDVELTEEVSETVAPKEKVAPKPKRGRNAKQTSIDQAEIVPEVAVEAVNDQTPPINVNHEANDAATSVEEAVLKPKRGRKNNQASVEQPTPSENTQPEEPIPTVAIEKPKRGRKPKQDSVVVEDTGNAVETKQQSQAPVRSKRGRNAKLEEEKVEGDGEIPPVETVEFQAPCEKSKRTRKAKQEPAELKEVQMAEIPITEKVEAPVASKGRRARTAKQDSVESVEEIPVESTSSATLVEAVEMHEPTAVVAAEKPRRGGRRTKQDAKSVIPVASTEVQDEPSVNPAEKPKRGRRVKQDLVVEEVEIIGEVPEEKAEQKPEVKEDNMDDPDSGEQPDAPVVKPTRGRGVKSVKNEVSQAIPAKRACRGTAPPLQEAAVTEAAVVSKPGPRGRAGKVSKAEDADNTTEASVEPAKRGRKAAAKPVKDDATAAPSTEEMVEEKCVTAELPPVEVTKGKVSRKGKAVSAAHTDEAHATEDVNDTQMSKKSVNWKNDLAVTYEITTPTPVVKAARGRKAKLVDQDEASQGTSTKRGRRGKESTEPSTTEMTTSKPDNKRKASRNASKAEEEDLSDKTLPSEPIKRARRGAKVTDAASEAITQGAEEMEPAHKVPDRHRVNASKKGVVVDSVQADEAETQPRTRRGRAAKK